MNEPIKLMASGSIKKEITIVHETKTATTSANGTFYLTVPLEKILFTYCISPFYYMSVRNGSGNQAVGFVFDENFSKGANKNITYGIVYQE